MTLSLFLLDDKDLPLFPTNIERIASIFSSLFLEDACNSPIFWDSTAGDSGSGSAPPSGGFFSGIFPGTGSASAPPSGGLFSVVLSGSWGVFAEIPLSLPESELVLPPFFFHHGGGLVWTKRNKKFA